MDRIINILKTLDRPGTDKVIEFMEENNYKGSRCYGHHKYAGGLVDHSLEGTLRFLPQLKMRPSSNAPNPVECREAPPTSSFPDFSEPP